MICDKYRNLCALIKGVFVPVKTYILGSVLVSCVRPVLVGEQSIRLHIKIHERTGWGVLLVLNSVYW